MLRRYFASMAIAALMPLSVFAAEIDNASATIKLSQPTMVPGATLQPGTYSIRVLDHLQDRVVVRVEQPGASSNTTFLGVPTPKLKGTTHNGMLLWGAAPEGKAALRGFEFGKGAWPIEFVYPKDEAVALAKLNDGSVAAVDPASEGHPAEVANLTKDEMQMVTLWLLTPTRVGPGDTAGPQIKAEKLTQVASAKPPIARLPHTASLLPATLLIGLMAALGATLLAMRRAGDARPV